MPLTYIIVALGLLLSLEPWLGHARATVVTFNVTGTVSDFGGDQDVGWQVPVGTPFHGTYTFDSSVADADPLDPTIGKYWNSIISSSFWLGDDQFVDIGLPSHIFSMNDRAGNDQYKAQDSSLTYRGYPVSATLLLIDSDESVFASDSLPLAPPPLAEFEFAQFVVISDGNEFGVNGPVTSLTVLPESRTFLLLVAGSVLAGQFHRSRQAEWERGRS